MANRGNRRIVVEGLLSAISLFSYWAGRSSIQQVCFTPFGAGLYRQTQAQSTVLIIGKQSHLATNLLN